MNDKKINQPERRDNHAREQARTGEQQAEASWLTKNLHFISPMNNSIV